MSTLEAIFIAILFLIPGFLIEKITNRIFQKTIIEDYSDFDKTVKYIILSIETMIINIIFISKVCKNTDLKTVTQLQEKLGEIEFLIKYLGLTILVCGILIFLNELLKRGILYISNIIRDKNNLPTETKFTTIWDEIFENKAINLTDVYISIEKDGNIITQGVLKSYSPPNFKNKELKLCYTNDIKKILEENKSKNESEMLFDEISMEYFNFETGILVKFYDMSKYNNYVESNAEI